MKKNILIFFLLIKTFIFSEIILDIDDTKLSDGETAILSVIIKDQKLSELKIEGIENFKILNQGQNSSTQIINGKKTSSKTYQYRVLPLREGNFKLKAFGKYKKDSFQSNVLEIEVNADFSESKELKENFFIESSSLKDKYYFGEKILLSEHLISTVNIQNFGFVDNGKYSDFTEKNITEKGFDAKTTRVNGKKAIDYTVYKAILEPIRSGKFTLAARTFQVNIADSNSFFADVKPYYLKTKQREIEVMELPAENKPIDFSGIVGTVQLDSKFDKTEIEFGEAVTLTVKLRGNANLDTLEKVVPENIPGMKVYQNVKDVKEFIVDNKYIVEKEYEVVFIPQNYGELKIPEIKLSYFNTKTENYDNLKIPANILKINGNETKKDEKISDYNTSENQEIIISQINNEVIKPKKNNYLILIVILVTTNVITLIFLIKKQFREKNSQEKTLNIAKLKTKIRKSKNIHDLYLNFNEAIKLKYSISIKSYSSEQIIRELGEEKGIELSDIVNEIENLKYFNKNPEQDIIQKILKAL